MASDFVDNIEDNSENKFSIAASYVSVFSRSDKSSDRVG